MGLVTPKHHSHRTSKELIELRAPIRVRIGMKYSNTTSPICSIFLLPQAVAGHLDPSSSTGLPPSIKQQNRNGLVMPENTTGVSELLYGDIESLSRDDKNMNRFAMVECITVKQQEVSRTSPCDNQSEIAVTKRPQRRHRPAVTGVRKPT